VQRRRAPSEMRYHSTVPVSFARAYTNPFDGFALWSIYDVGVAHSSGFPAVIACDDRRVRSSVWCCRQRVFSLPGDGRVLRGPSRRCGAFDAGCDAASRRSLRRRPRRCRPGPWARMLSRRVRNSLRRIAQHVSFLAERGCGLRACDLGRCRTREPRTRATLAPSYRVTVAPLDGANRSLQQHDC
jgi:hypothetical protein